MRLANRKPLPVVRISTEHNKVDIWRTDNCIILSFNSIPGDGSTNYIEYHVQRFLCVEGTCLKGFIPQHTFINNAGYLEFRKVDCSIDSMDLIDVPDRHFMGPDVGKMNEVGRLRGGSYYIIQESSFPEGHIHTGRPEVLGGPALWFNQAVALALRLISANARELHMWVHYGDLNTKYIAASGAVPMTQQMVNGVMVTQWYGSHNKQPQEVWRTLKYSNGDTHVIKWVHPDRIENDQDLIAALSM